jgi:uncharacterized iron-regulated membrane protein
VTARRAFLLAHQWVGLAAAGFLVVIAVSGSALVFENEIDRALNPALSYVPNPDGSLRPRPLEELVARVNAERPYDPVGGVRIAERPDQAYEFSSRVRRSTFVDPYDGRVLGSRNRETSLARRLHLLHTRLVAGDIGEQMVGWFSVAMLGLATSGLVLWWPRKIAALHSSPSWKRINFDLHNVLGFYSWLVIVAITLSGVLIAFEATTDPVVRRLNDRPEPLSPQSTPVPGAKRITLDQAIAIGESALPRRRVEHQRAGEPQSRVSHPEEVPGGPDAGRPQPRLRRPVQRRRAAGREYAHGAPGHAHPELETLRAHW